MQSSPHVLIIEDDPNLRRTLALIFQQAGYTVATYCQVQDALSGPSSWKYDLIILNGDQAKLTDAKLWEVLGQARPAVSVLLLNSSPGMNPQSLAGPTGRQVHLVKPIDPAQILACVRAILNQAALRAD